tara:strand:- start:1363 stop:1983 length:621 start_codon:yes stop_codon:yes gene_type:complete
MALTKVKTSVIADDAVGADQLASSAVVTASIVDDAVTTDKIANDAITADKLAASAVVTASIVNDNVTQDKIADDAVGADQLASSAVVTASIVDDAVTSAKLAHALDIVTSVTVGGASNGVAISNGKIELKNSGTVSKLDFFCESSNAHYIRLQAPAHANFSGNVVITLPPNDGDSGQFLKTNGSGVTSWATVASLSTGKAFFMGQL